MISIDGLEEIHNKNRPYLSGGSTYSRIVQNVERFKQVLPKLKANMVVTKTDIPFVRRSVQKLWELGVNSLSVALSFGSEQAYESLDYTIWHDQIKELAGLTYHNIINDKPYFLDNLIESVRWLERPKKMASCTLFNNGTFVFVPDGDIYKCHRNVGNAQYKIANVKDPHLNLLKYRLEKNKIEKCMNCWAQLLCDDGCPYEHVLRTGSIDNPSEEWCSKTKIMQLESLKLYAKLTLHSRAQIKDLSANSV
ncbi:radical SAM protein [Paenibacillus albidus]|uniref:radical SAM protein n=1 Tax=Paenibacillus albidus TaxID=2041023 RepID=UPI001BE69336|nr:SPASM domain-containing protein [Paenibacillus albidus]MBT2291848.1 radical SAM protein [Paenibacillus albidus]